jgi:hypothetical protein
LPSIALAGPLSLSTDVTIEYYYRISGNNRYLQETSGYIEMEYTKFGK